MGDTQRRDSRQSQSGGGRRPDEEETREQGQGLMAGVMRKHASASQKAVNRARTALRHDMERLALTHRGCAQARGCGCLVDLALTVLGDAEAKLFALEIDSYADPTTTRRVVLPDNTVSPEKD